jgi:ubiquinone/menaquinone biosynthesis C-methylase UbiE
MSEKHPVCPWWLGYALVNPLRRLVEKPERMLRPFVREGMTVLEPGCGMGFFTLEAARLVGPAGKVIAVDLQEKMINGLRRRVSRAGLQDRVEARVASPESLAIDNLAGKVDLALALYFVHEVLNQSRLFTELARALKPGGRIWLLEPKGHVSEEGFSKTLEGAQSAGLAVETRTESRSKRYAVLTRPV